MATAGPKNRQGEQGPKGDPGVDGKNAVQPRFDIGDVSIGEVAKVWLTGTITRPILNFVLPRGPKGDPGKDGKDGVKKVVFGETFASGSGSGTTEDGTQTNPFTTLNVKKVPENKFHLIKENHENIVSRIQIIEGVLIVDGVNTIL